jgi:hypothetical protein
MHELVPLVWRARVFRHAAALALALLLVESEEADSRRVRHNQAYKQLNCYNNNINST